MEVKFADTFFDSLKKTMDRERWYWKLFDLFRYDIPRFLKNVWRFRKALWNHYWWDHHGTLRFMEIGLDHMATNLEERGLEVDASRLKKVAAMKRAAELIRNYNEDRYLEIAEAELGEIVFRGWDFAPVDEKGELFEINSKLREDEEAHNRKVYDRAREIGESEWQELWQIFKGQSSAEYVALMHGVTTEEERERDRYYEWFDGTDMRGWWD